jgi:hypothetical protein
MKSLVFLSGLLSCAVGCGEDRSSPLAPPDETPSSLVITGCHSAALYQNTHEVCDAMDVRFEDPNNCGPMGWIWDGSACVQPGDTYSTCIGADCDKLTETREECESQHAACTAAPLVITGCHNAALYQGAHDACDAMDVQFQDPCNCGPMGWIWDGSACVQPGDSYCTCTGSDCDKLTATREECEGQHAACV